MMAPSHAKLSRAQLALVVVCACLLTFITGSSYVFSIFRTPAIERFGLDSAMGAYALTNALAPLPMLVGGWFIDRGKAVWTASIGAFCAAAGWGLAGQASSGTMFVLCYGLLGGIGMGLILTSALSNTLRFFPGKRGLISGLISCINGAAGMVMAPVAQKIIEQKGLGSTLAVFASIFVVIGIIVAVFYKAAPVAGYDAKGAEPAGSVQPSGPVSLRPLQVLVTLDFWVLFVLFTAGAFSGLMVVSNSLAIGTEMFGLTSIKAAFFVSLYSIAGTLGRFVFGWISDAIGKTRALMVTFCADIAGLVVLTVWHGHTWALGVGLFTVGITYGGTIAIMPAFVMDRFGPRHQGINYALVFCGFSVAAMISPRLGASIGLTNDGDFSRAFYIAMLAALIGVLCAVVLHVKRKVRN